MSAERVEREVRAALEAGEPHEAFTSLRPLLTDTGSPPEAAPLARSLELLRRIAEALGDAPLVERLGEVLAASDDPEALYDLGYQLIESGLSDVAVPVLRRARLLVPGSVAVTTELAAALERVLRFDQAAAVLREDPALLAESFMCRYLLAFNALMSGDLEEPGRLLPQLAPSDDAEADMAARIERCLARAARVRDATPLDHGDLRGWHYVIEGALLTHLSPHGWTDAMRGRYAWLQDSLPLCRLGLERLAAVLEAWGNPCQRVLLPPERSAEVFGRAVAARLDLPAEPLAAEGDPGPGLVVAYDLDLLDSEVLAPLLNRPAGQILFAHATCWTETFPLTADLTTLLYQTNSAPWAPQIVYDPETRDTRRGEADPRPAAELAEALLAAEPQGEQDAPAEDALEVLLGLARRVGAPPPGRRERHWAGSPVASNRFA